MQRSFDEHKLTNNKIENGVGDMSIDENDQEIEEMDQDRSNELPEDQWRALSTIVRDVGPSLSPDEELGDLAAAEEAVNARDNERGQVLDRLQNELRLLTKQHQLAAQAAQRPSNHPSPSEHEAQVRSLEQQQYTMGKQLNEEQVSVGKKEGELARWKADKEEIGKFDVGADDYIDGKTIRLKLFSGVGFSLIDTEGTNPKILVRNDPKPDVLTVSIENPKQRVYYSNLLWNMVSD